MRVSRIISILSDPTDVGNFAHTHYMFILEPKQILFSSIWQTNHTVTLFVLPVVANAMASFEYLYTLSLAMHWHIIFECSCRVHI